MAYDLALGQTGRDWSCGIGDVPAGAHGYAPVKWISRTQAETRVKEIMAKPPGLWWGKKPTLAEAEEILKKELRASKTGIMSGVGSVLFPVKEQKVLFAKIDDVRYDIRGARAAIGTGLILLSGALAFLGIASVYRTSKRGE